MEKRDSVKCDPNQGSDPTAIEPDQDSGSTVSCYIPLKSIQTFQTQDEFLVAMREDLAEWFSALYDLSIQESNLLSHLSTGVLLCQHSNAFNDAMKISSGGSSKESNSTSAASDIASGSGPAAVQYSRGAQPGTFHSRVNISNFLSWCRGTLGVRDTLLFETEDLVQARNERNVVLCLLEVARRGARIGMPAPSLVQLEAEIDDEIRRDLDTAAGDDVTAGGRHGNDDDVIGTRRDVGVQTMVGDGGDGGGGGDVTVQAFLRSSSESLCSSESSFRHLQSTPVKMSHRRRHRPPHPPPPSVYHSSPSSSSSSTPTRPVRSKPVIEVDMMSLDEMVRKILNRCTCEFQYPMIRVSEGKYRIGESLTFIFVRILRNHVMVRIGGGWDTLENYLNRHDPCRMEPKASKTGFSSRHCAHTSDASSASSSAISSSSTADQSDASQAEADDADGGVSRAGKSEGQEGSERRISDDFSSDHHRRHLRGLENDDLCGEEGVRSTSGKGASRFLLSSSSSVATDADDISATRTRVSPSGKTVVDVACQTDGGGGGAEEQLTRRYSSSSSGASSLEPTNERLEVNSYKVQEQKCEISSAEDAQKCLSGRSSVDLIAKSTEGNKDKTRDDCIAGALPHSAQTPQKEGSRALNPGTKSSRASPPNTCRRCGDPVNASENRTGSGLCLACTKQHGTPDGSRSSVQNKRFRNERPGSAQDRRLPDRPGSAQEKRRRPERPESARVSVSRALTFSSGRGEKEAAGRNAELKRPSKQQRPASAQERGRPAASVPRLLPPSPTKQSQDATRVVAVAATSDPSALPPSSRQRPSSAREQRRQQQQQQGAPQMRPGHAGEGARRVLPLKGGPSEQETRSDGGDLVDEGGGGGGGGKNSNKAKLETTVLLRRRRSFNAHAAKLPLVRELSNMTACDAPQGSYIPKAGKNLSAEIQEDVTGGVGVDDDDGNDPTVKMRPRKDVKRKESITKIPKPVG